MFPRKLLLTLLVSFCFATLTLRAQTVTGSLEGRVADQTGAVVPAALVIIRNTETGQTRTVKTNDEGFYRAPFLPLGAYIVTASANGFATTKQENVQVTLNQTLVINFSLKPAAASAEVTITAEAAPINTTNAEIKQSLSAQEIVDRPVLNQGSFLTLAETFTGFQENPNNGQNNPTASSGSSINFNGTGTRGATFQINGVNNDDSSENQHRQGASLATIKEFQVISNNFTAEFGRGYGAVVLVQTKNGTNNYHGELYEYHNDSFVNAKSFFGTGVKKPVIRRNQYGGVLGFQLLPIAPLPQVDFPTISVNVSLPGASPETMAATVATPLERSLGAIAGVTEITSTSALGSATIAIQFDLSRRIDKAAQDVQSAINAAAADLPSDMPTLPSIRKINPAASPILVIALTSRTLPRLSEMPPTKAVASTPQARNMVLPRAP